MMLFLDSKDTKTSTTITKSIFNYVCGHNLKFYVRKKIVFLGFAISLLFAVSGYSQIGFRGGINIANMNISQDHLSLNPDNRVGLVLGVFHQFPIANNFSVQPELLFIQKGYKLKNNFFGTTSE